MLDIIGDVIVGLIIIGVIYFQCTAGVLPKSLVRRWRAETAAPPSRRSRGVPDKII